MKFINRRLFILVLLTASVSIVEATEAQHNSCVGNPTIESSQFGKVNEHDLQILIDNKKRQLKKIRHGRGSHIQRKIGLKRDLRNMQVTMQKLHGQMYVGGCADAIHGVSVDTRVVVMENRMKAMQSKMDKMKE